MYEYDVKQYDPQIGQGGLFLEYINTFLKLKTEASGYHSCASHTYRLAITPVMLVIT